MARKAQRIVSDKGSMSTQTAFSKGTFGNCNDLIVGSITD